MQQKPSLSERPTVPCPPPWLVKREAPASAVSQPPRGGATPCPSPPRKSGTVSAHDRRIHPRVHVAFDVSLGSESHYFSAPCADLSPGGLFVSTYRVLVPGAELSVEFDLPASRVVAKGRVRWVREAADGASPGYGIAFTQLSRFDRTLIETFCTPCSGSSGSGGGCLMAG
jgi:uncharacterized protein (TIGR02266 family)